MAKAAKIIHLPQGALVVLVGVAGSGKSTFANEKFRATEILSSDHFRGMVSDDEGDQGATDDAFLLLHLVLEKRLQRGLVCVVDATNLRPEHRAKLMRVARLCNRSAVAIRFDTPLDQCLAQAGGRRGRVVNAAVIHEQAAILEAQTDDALLREGFRKVYRLTPADRVQVRRTMAARAAAGASVE